MILLVGTSFDAATRKRSHQHRGRLGELRALAQGGRITLVFAAHDEAHNDAVVLREILLGRSIPRGSRSRSPARYQRT